jgi:hypothetical protein
MAFYKIKSGRVNGVRDAVQYIAPYGQIFYDDEDNKLRIGDGVTAGGNPAFIPVATSSTVGGIKLGPGIVLNSEGQILINSEGLSFTFGDFSGTVGTYTDTTDYALLSSLNANEDVVIASNGTGTVKVVGQFDIYKTNGSVTASLEDEEPFFRVKDDGQVRMLVPAADPIEGAVEIIGSASGSYIPPGQAGAMLQITGNPELPARVYLDGNAEYASFVARRFNGTVAAPTAVLANQDVFRLNATAATSSGMGGVALGQIRITALENQTTSTQGSKIVFTVTPIGSAATSRVDVATISVADGVSATKFTGPLIGTATTATTAGTVTTPAQPAITSVGTLTSLTVTNLVTAKNYSGQVRNLGTITAGAGTEITIDFATDHMVRFNYTTEPVQVAFTNYSAGKTVTLIAVNTNAANRQLQIGIAAANAQGAATLDINGDTTGIVTYYCTGATVDDVFASTVYTI